MVIVNMSPTITFLATALSPPVSLLVCDWALILYAFESISELISFTSPPNLSKSDVLLPMIMHLENDKHAIPMKNKTTPVHVDIHVKRIMGAICMLSAVVWDVWPMICCHVSTAVDSAIMSMMGGDAYNIFLFYFGSKNSIPIQRLCFASV